MYQNLLFSPYNSFIHSGNTKTMGREGNTKGIGMTSRDGLSPRIGLTRNQIPKTIGTSVIMNTKRKERDTKGIGMTRDKAPLKKIGTPKEKRIGKTRNRLPKTIGISIIRITMWIGIQR